MSSIKADEQKASDQQENRALIVNKAERRMKRFGGYVYKHEKDEGRILFANTQKEVSLDVFRPYIEDIANEYYIIVELTDFGLGVSVDSASDYVAKSGANAVVFIVNSETMPTLLIAPETKWAFLNVNPLLKGNPAKELLAKRVRIESWRAFGYLCGAANSTAKGCVMAPINSIKDIDRLNAWAISPEPYMGIIGQLSALGIKPYERYTYRTACEEGWAPAPTNHYQQAIWDKVKAAQNTTPTSPIRIHPGQKPKVEK